MRSKIVFGTVAPDPTDRDRQEDEHRADEQAQRRTAKGSEPAREEKTKGCAPREEEDGNAHNATTEAIRSHRL